DQANARAQLLKFLSQHITTTEPTALITLGRKGVRVVHDFNTDYTVLRAALKHVSSRADTLKISGNTTQTQVYASDKPGPVQLATGIDPTSFRAETSALDDFYNGLDGGVGSFQTAQAIGITVSALAH